MTGTLKIPKAEKPKLSQKDFGFSIITDGDEVVYKDPKGLIKELEKLSKEGAFISQDDPK